MEERLQPKLSGGADLVALFAEDQREPLRLQHRVAPQLGRRAAYQRGFSNSSRSNDEHMPVGALARSVVTHDFQDQIEGSLPDHERTYQVVVAEDARIVGERRTSHDGRLR